MRVRVKTQDQGKKYCTTENAEVGTAERIKNFVYGETNFKTLHTADKVT